MILKAAKGRAGWRFPLIVKGAVRLRPSHQTPKPVCFAARQADLNGSRA
jgi:hypothetical protein